MNTIKYNRQKGLSKMSEMIQNFIGKECIITTMNASVTGKIESAEGGWIKIRALDKNANTEIINVDYIIRIQEYPRNKNGKRKAAIY